MRNVSHAHTDIYSLTSRLSLSVYNDVHKITTPTRPPRSYVSRRYPGPMYVILTPFTTQLRYHTHVSFAFLSLAPFDRIPGYTPRARPRALTGLRLPAVGSPNTCFPGRTYGCQ